MLPPNLAIATVNDQDIRIGNVFEPPIGKLNRQLLNSRVVDVDHFTGSRVNGDAKRSRTSEDACDPIFGEYSSSAATP